MVILRILFIFTILMSVSCTDAQLDFLIGSSNDNNEDGGNGGDEGSLRISKVSTSDVGTKSEGDRIEIKIEFNQNVELPTHLRYKLRLETGTNDRYAFCHPNDDKDQLICHYDVTRGDESVSLQFVDKDSLTAEGDTSASPLTNLELPLNALRQGIIVNTSSSTLSVATLDTCSGHTDSEAWQQYNQSGSGSIGDPFLLCSAEQLDDLARMCNSIQNVACAHYYKLGRNIDYLGQSFAGIGDDNSGFEFAGQFDGDGFSIKNLKLVGGDGLGFFVATSASATIQNLTLEDIEVISTGASYIAALVACNSGSISNVTVRNLNLGTNTANDSVGGVIGKQSGAEDLNDIHLEGINQILAPNAQWVGGVIGIAAGGGRYYNLTAQGSVSGNSVTGGLIGKFQQGSQELHDSYFMGSVIGNANSIGGLVGYAFQVGIYDSFSLGQVTNSAGSASYTGGLVGEFTEGVLQRSYSKANVSAANVYQVGGVAGILGAQTHKVFHSEGAINGDSMVGGLAGKLLGVGDIFDSYSNSTLTGFTNIGGLVGYDDGAGTINQSHSVSSTPSGPTKGSLVGYLQNTAHLTNLYVNSDISPGSMDGNAAGSYFPSNAQGLNRVQFKLSSNFAGFDFTTTWEIQNDLYPTLKDNIDPKYMANSLPVVKKDEFTVVSGETLTLPKSSLLANDLDPNQEGVQFLSYDPLTSAGGSVVTFNPTSLKYTPPIGFYGTDSFNYRVTDDSGQEVRGRIYIEVLPFKDNFLRADSHTLGNDWEEYELNGGNIAETSEGNLKLSSDNSEYGLVLDHALELSPSGLYMLSFEMEFIDNFGYTGYALGFQLGDSSQMLARNAMVASQRLEGVAMSLKWAGTDLDHSKGGFSSLKTFGWENTNVDSSELAIVNELAKVRVLIDLDDKSFTVFLNGQSSSKVDFIHEVELNNLRIFTNKMDTTNLDKHQIKNIQIKRIH